MTFSNPIYNTSVTSSPWELLAHIRMQLDSCFLFVVSWNNLSSSDTQVLIGRKLVRCWLGDTPIFLRQPITRTSFYSCVHIVDVCDNLADPNGLPSPIILYIVLVKGMFSISNSIVEELRFQYKEFFNIFI